MMKVQFQRVFYFLVIVLAICMSIFILKKTLLICEPETQVISEEESGTEEKSTSSKKLVLIYTKLFGHLTWPNLNSVEIKTVLSRCEYKNCDVTYNKKKISSADAVLFHGTDVPSSDSLRTVAQYKMLNQKWIFLMHESPEHFSYDYSSYNGLFDWLMSYKSSSDLLLPYYHYQKLTSADITSSPATNYATGKDKLAIWFVSDCPGYPREGYIKELKTYMPITVGGSCAKRLFNETIKCKQGSSSCRNFIKRHKFALAFENSFCDGYVTEKYWDQIGRGTVPVVMGASSYDGDVIPGSFIDASKFSSIESLAKYLLYLNLNDTAYNEYFTWKQKYKRTSPEKMCDICKALHTNKPGRTYDNIWSAEQDCTPFQWKADQMLKQVKNSRANRAKSLKKKIF